MPTPPLRRSDFRSALLLALALLMASGALASAQILFPEARKWRLTEDFKPSLTSASSADRYGHPDVWQYKAAPGFAQNPASYVPLTIPATTPLKGWMSDGGAFQDSPFILFNQGARPVRVRNTLVEPGHAVTSPLFNTPQVVAWRAPFTGFVRVTGSLAALELRNVTFTLTGDYTIQLASTTTTTVAAGSVAKGQKRSFSEQFTARDLDELPVTAGDVLYFRFSTFQDSSGENLLGIDINIDEVLIPIKAIRALSAPSSNAAAGNSVLDAATKTADPVDTIFGNYTTQAIDLQIKGEGAFPGFVRTYNSALPEDGLLGWGWNISYDLRLRRINQSNIIDVKRGDGRVDRFEKQGNVYVGPPGLLDTLTATATTATLTTADGTVYQFNQQNRVSSATDRFARQTTLTYVDGFWTELTDPNGRLWRLAYDRKGRLGSITDPAGRKVAYGYDAAGNLTTVTNPLKGITRYGYDSEHRITKVTDPRKVVALQNSYDANGKVVQQIDARGSQAWEYFTDRTIYTDPVGAQWTTFFNADFRVTHRVNPLGHTVSFTYNQAGLLTSETDGRQGVTSYTYDAAGRKSTVTNAEGETTSFTYAADNSILSVTDSLGHATSYTYDQLGRLETVTAPDDSVTQYTYDAAFRISSVTDPAGQTNFSYDAVGNRTSVQNAAGFSTSFSYDAVGNVVSETDPLGKKTTYSYDVLGRLLSRTAPDGGRTRYTYDPAGNLTSETDPLSRKTTHTYNGAGDRISTRNAARQTTKFSYNALGRRTSTTLPDRSVSTISYDAAGRVSSEKSPLQLTIAYTYDANDNLLTITNPLGQKTTYTYDGANRLITVADPLNNVTTFTYDDAGRRVAVKDALNRITEYAYDDVGRLTSETNALGKTRTNTYDAAGRLLSTTNAAGETLTYSYEARGLVTSLTDGTNTTTYIYDNAGRRTSMTDALGTTDYSYDAAGRLLSATTPQGTISYAYDKFGNRTKMTANGVTTSYTYDPLNRLGRVSSGSARVSYLYSSTGNLIGEVFGNGMKTTRSYDLDGRLTDIKTGKGPGAPLFRATYTLDAADRRIAEAGENYEATFTYDAAGRLTGSTIDSGGFIDTFTYTYDAVGNRLSSNESDVLITNYSYDAANRIVLAGTTPFVYDDDGRLVSDLPGRTYAYDAFGRLVSITEAGNIVATYKYDGNGNNVAETGSAGFETKYLIDTKSALPLRVAATTGDSTTHLVHGYGIVAQYYELGFAYNHGDGVGSVRLRTNINGVMLERLDYAPFGSRLGSLGETGEYSFAGEPYTFSGKLVNLRARFYSPQLGRFLTTDALEPAYLTESPNLYLYAGNDPLNFVDPSGNNFIGAIGGFIGAVGNGIKQGVQGAVNTGKAAVSAIGDGLKSAANGIGSVFNRKPAPPVVTDPPPAATPPAATPGLASAGVISGNGSTVVANGGNNVVANGGNNVLARGGAGLISDKGTGVISRDGAGVISRDGAGIVSRDGAGIVSRDGAGLVGLNGSNAKPGKFTLQQVSQPGSSGSGCGTSGGIQIGKGNTTRRVINETVAAIRAAQAARADGQ